MSAINHPKETEEYSTNHKAHHFLGEEEATLMTQLACGRQGEFLGPRNHHNLLTMTKLSPASSPQQNRKGSIC